MFKVVFLFVSIAVILFTGQQSYDSTVNAHKKKSIHKQSRRQSSEAEEETPTSVDSSANEQNKSKAKKQSQAMEETLTSVDSTGANTSQINNDTHITVMGVVHDKNTGYVAAANNGGF